MAGGARLYGRRSMVILQEERGYIAGGARLYGRRSKVIWQGARLYDAMILMAPLLRWHTHSAWTNVPEKDMGSFLFLYWCINIDLQYEFQVL